MDPEYHSLPENDTGGNINYVFYVDNQTNITNLNYIEWTNILSKPTFGSVAFTSEYDALSNVPFKRNNTNDIIYRGNRVGIGLQEGQSPINKLHLIGDLFITEDYDTWDFLRFYHTGNMAYLDFGGCEDGVSFRMNNGTTPFENNPAMTEFMRFRNDKIGIFTNNPQYKFDINGSLNATSLYVNSTNIDTIIDNRIDNKTNVFNSNITNSSNDCITYINNKAEVLNNTITNSSNDCITYTSNTSNKLVNYNNLINTPNLSVYITSINASNSFITSNVHSNTSNFLVNYNNLINKPNLFNGSYTDLTNKPDLSVYITSINASNSFITSNVHSNTSNFLVNYNNLINKPNLFNGSYTDLTNKPDLSVYITSINASNSFITSNVHSNTSNFLVNYNNLINKPDLSSYITSTNASNSFITSNVHSNTSNFLVNYNNLINKPSLFSGIYTDLTNKPDLTVYITSTNASNSFITSNVHSNTSNFLVNYNNLVNKPDLSSYITSTNASNTFITSNVHSNTSNFLVNYNNLINKPDLSSYITTTNANALNTRFFNNNGNNHGNLTDFNSTTQFGYNFIMGTTNGPNVNSAGQYYSWDIGLGINYGFGTYRAQFALPRNVANPYLCVRYQENGGYGGWQRINAGYADSAGSATTAGSLTSGDKTISGTLTATALRTTDFYMSSGTCDCAILKTRNYVLLPNYWKIIIGTYGGYANSMAFWHEIKPSTWYLRGDEVNTYQNLSDERVKREIKPIDNALSIIERLEPKQYIKLVDRDKTNECGLIAQDAEKIDEIKNYVYNEPYYISDIYEDCPYDNDNKIFRTINDFSLILKVGTKIKIVLDKKQNEIDIVNIKSKWCCVYTEIIEVLGDNKYKIKDDIDINETDIFIYGTFKDDFKTIDYNSLYAINLQATKDLYKLVQKLEERISYLENLNNLNK